MPKHTQEVAYKLFYIFYVLVHILVHYIHTDVGINYRVYGNHIFTDRNS